MLEEDALSIAAKGAGKTVLACLVGHDALIDGHLPSYAFPEQAVQALAHAVRYAEWRDRPAEAAPASFRVHERTARQLVQQELSAHPDGRWLSPATTARLLDCSGITMVESIEVDGPEAAAAASERIGPLRPAAARLPWLASGGRGGPCRPARTSEQAAGRPAGSR
ncbi:hypothetical protein [Nonomuraea sp. NPDC049158]|uniref:hypothetical protein n=1 Tax=Nonomuraea sp. NPDC049158 TaxID=3155649 RepID=UPI0033FFD839